jgi:hypothetical protein
VTEARQAFQIGFAGTPGEAWFDDSDNLIVQDHTWNLLWVINYDVDPVWLRPL